MGVRLVDYFTVFCFLFLSPTSFCNYITPVKLAYSLYNTTDSHEMSNNTEKCPVIIMHGLLGSKSNWNSVSKSIRSRNKYEVISVDARNHGDSPHTSEFNYPSLAEDVRLLMTDLRISKINAIGHSLGGRAMMYLALQYPHLINSLIVVDISPVRTPQAIHDISPLLDLMASVKIGANISLSKGRKMVDEKLKEKIPDMVLRQFLLTNLVEVDGQCKWRINLDLFISNFSSIANFEPPPNKKFEGQVLFIGGGKSTFMKEEDHESIMKYFPNAEFQYIKGAGHFVHAEKPAEFLDLVCNFLNRL